MAKMTECLTELLVRSEPASDPPNTQPAREIPLTQVALRELRERCKRGQGDACFLLAAKEAAQEVKDGIHRDEAVRRHQSDFRRGCDLGSAGACTFVFLPSGYYCVDASNDEAFVTPLEDGQCARDLAGCQSIRDGLRGLGWSTSDCQARKNAACFSYRIVLDERAVTACYPTFTDCEAWRGQQAKLAKASRDVERVTKCQARKQ